MAQMIYDKFDRVFWYDLETRNKLDIDDPLYVETAGVLLFIYAIDDEPVKVWDAYTHPQMPEEVYREMTREKTLKRHFNGRSFDDRVVRHALDLHVSPWDQEDIREVALRYNLPAGLAKLCTAIGLEGDDAKDSAGKMLIKLFCTPLAELVKKGTKFPKDFPISRDEVLLLIADGYEFAPPELYPVQWAMFKRYGKSDVHSMRTAFHKMPAWNNTTREHHLCVINHIINDAGITVDLPFAKRMAVWTKEDTANVTARIKMLTDGISPRSHKKYKAWLQEQLPDEVIPGAGKPVIERLQKEVQLPGIVKRVFELQQSATSSSLGKFPKAVMLAHPYDSRVRYTIDIRGAGTTGRYGARGGLQVHNFPRPSYAPWVIEAMTERVLLNDRPKNLITRAPSMLRGMLIPDPGCRFVNADLSSIEGRVMCWQSGFTEQVDDFHNGINAYFKNGPVFGFTYEEIAKYKKSSKPEEYNLYMLCKVMELALIYQGGVGALVSMGNIYGMNMREIADLLLSRNLIPDHKLLEARKALNFIRLTKRGRASVAACKLTDHQWMALDGAKRLWRDRHAPVVGFWNTIQRAMFAAFDQPGVAIEFGAEDRLQACYLDDIKWFGIRLPSGRVLSYYDARIGGASEARPEEEEPDDQEDDNDQMVLLYRTFDRNGEPSPYYKAAHPGKIANNITQGTAASVLDDILYDCVMEGWDPRFHIHDQVINNVRKTDRERTPEALVALMSRERPWAPGLPLAAEGEYMDRFAK